MSMSLQDKIEHYSETLPTELREVLYFAIEVGQGRPVDMVGGYAEHGSSYLELRARKNRAKNAGFSQEQIDEVEAIGIDLGKQSTPSNDNEGRDGKTPPPSKGLW